MELVRRPGNSKIYEVWNSADENDRRTLLSSPAGLYGRVDDLAKKENISLYRMKMAGGWQWAYIEDGAYFATIFDSYWEGRRFIEQLPNLE